MRREKCNKNTNELRAGLLGRKCCKGEGGGARPTQVIYDSIRAAIHPKPARPHHVSAGISHQSLTPLLLAITTLRQEALSIHTQSFE